MGRFLFRIGIFHHLFSMHRALWVQLFLNSWSLPGSGAGCLIEGFFISCGHLTVFCRLFCLFSASTQRHIRFMNMGHSVFLHLFDSLFFGSVLSTKVWRVVFTSMTGEEL